MQQDWFCTNGTPEEMMEGYHLTPKNIISQGFRYKKMCISSTHYAQSNSQVELVVKTTKWILADNNDNQSHLCHDYTA